MTDQDAQQHDVVPVTRQAGPPPPRTLAFTLTVALLGALVTAAAFGLGRLSGIDAASPTTTAAPVTTLGSTSTVPPTSTSVAPSTVAPTTTAPPPERSAIGDIVLAISPSVVQIETTFGQGSGVVYDARGHILTAAHVIDDALEQVTVTLPSGTELTGTVIGADILSDLAVVRVDNPDLLMPAAFAVDHPEIGDLAVAVGSPFGLEQTVTAGIVSSTYRLLDDIVMVQTDAAINPGNSGGPLVNSDGAVIGINDQIFSTSGVNEGVGFAIDVGLAVLVADQLIAGEPVRRAFLGVGVESETGDRPGARVTSVRPGSPAAAAGIAVDDLIVFVEGDPITNSEMLKARVITRPAGSTLDLTILRDDEELTLPIVLANSP